MHPIQEYDLHNVGALFLFPTSTDDVASLAQTSVKFGGSSLARGTAFLGTCFPFHPPLSFLTAAHCLVNAPPERLVLAFPNRRLALVEDVVSHPSIDVAIIRMQPGPTDLGREPPKMSCDYRIGDDFFSFGYPQLEYGDMQPLPTARLVKGHLQRFFQHRNIAGQKYHAAEMSTACPPGMSGSPVLTMGDSPRLVGIVTDFVDAGTLRSRSEEEEIVGNQKTTVVYRDIIRYGVCLLLAEHIAWLAQAAGAGGG